MAGTGWKGWQATDGPVSGLLPQSLHFKEASLHKSPATISAVCISILLSPQKCRSQLSCAISRGCVLVKLDNAQNQVSRKAQALLKATSQ